MGRLDVTGQEVGDPAVSGEKALPASPPQVAAEAGAQSSRGAEAGTSTACLGSQGASTRSLFRGSFPGGSWIRSGATSL